MANAQFDIGELKRILNRRKKPALWVGVGVLIIGILVAILVPPTYVSSSTILIEQQEIPQDLVRSTVTSFADQRIQSITQRTMTFANLSELIKKYDLYADDRRSEPMEAIIEYMRRDIKTK
ncbi:MAG TPA: Wzz/FepE/Etk N-terminal domain-containing protein, partial [Cellvibrionaceae bacterium]|nr:Wzz/FepE/Etk N-terminal domain-containing protein [Cellvibrionaceae bacterium]